jgi:hypothetical protein
MTDVILHWSRQRSSDGVVEPWHGVTSIAGGYTHLACRDRWTTVAVTLEHDSCPAAANRCRSCLRVDLTSTLMSRIDEVSRQYAVAATAASDEPRESLVEQGLRELMTSEVYVGRTPAVDFDVTDEVG